MIKNKATRRAKIKNRIRSKVQGTAEGEPFSFEELDEMLKIGKHGLRELFDIQKAALA